MLCGNSSCSPSLWCSCAGVKHANDGPTRFAVQRPDGARAGDTAECSLYLSKCKSASCLCLVCVLTLYGYRVNRPSEIIESNIGGL